MSQAQRKIEDWLEEKGYSVHPGPYFACFADSREVTYRPQESMESRIRGLLHECGHVLVSEAIKRPTSGVRYRRGYSETRHGKIRPRVSTADILHEEIEAWHRGFALAQRLGIRLDERAYWEDYGKCIKHYCKRAIKGDL